MPIETGRSLDSGCRQATDDIRDPLETIRDLIELIEAIDRRAPQLQRGGEAAIADAAVRLRIQAQARIAELEEIGAGASRDHGGRT